MGLERQDIEKILTMQLDGVRFATTVLRNRIAEQLAIANAQGELKGIKTIRLMLRKQGSQEAGVDVTGLASGETLADVMTIWLI